MNSKKILYSVLKELKAGNIEVSFLDYNITKEEFAPIIQNAMDIGYIEYAGVNISDRGKISSVVLVNAKVTPKGERYLEENSDMDEGYKGLEGIEDWLKS